MLFTYWKNYTHNMANLGTAYQLHERIYFVKAPDAIVQQLVTDFANIVAKTRSQKEAAPFYKFAATYGKPRK